MSAASAIVHAPPQLPADSGGPVTPHTDGVNRAPRKDPWMTDTYYGLPFLRAVNIIPYYGGSYPILDTFSASTVRAIYTSRRSKEFLAVRLYQALTSTRFEVYVNPARARLDHTEGVFEYGVTYYRIPRQVHNPGRNMPNKNACFLSTGVAFYSHLLTPYLNTVNYRTIVDRRIGIYPIEYEFQRGLAYLGTVANKDILRYSFSAGALHFVTRTREFSDRLTSRSVQGNDAFMGLDTGGDQDNAIHNVVTQNFPHALNFGCYVPIFDAREATFIFNRGHFRELASLPLFQGEVPHGALVTVGYTTCVFHELDSDPEAPADSGIAIFFVQFVLLHSL